MGREILDLLLDLFGNSRDLGEVLVAEALQVLVDKTARFVDSLLENGWVNAQEVVIEPALHVHLPVVDGGPQLVVGSELLQHFLDVLIGSLFEQRQVFVLVVLLSLVCGRHELFVQGTCLRGNVLEGSEVIVSFEVANLVLELDNLGLKLILVLLHDVDELITLLVKVVTLLANLVVSITRRAKQTPLAVEVFRVLKLVLEAIEDLVHLHARSNLILELGDLARGVTHGIFDGREVLNVFGCALDSEVKSVEGVHGTVGHGLGFLTDELNDLSSNLLVLGGDNVADATAVDAEHRHNSDVLDLLAESRGRIFVLKHKLLQLAGLRLVFLVGELSNDLIRVKLVLVLVDLEGLDVVFERLSALVDLLHQALILSVDPGVLVRQCLLVLYIGSLR